jgi:trehalose-phosphatase
MTGHLFTKWDEVEPLIRDCDVMLFLDCDGTLAPIVRHPALAKLSLENKKLLQSLSWTEDLTTAIVSGRSLAHLKRLVGLKRLIYIGNHGLECEGPSLRFVHPQAVTAECLLKTLTYRFKQAFKSFPRIFVENKGLTMSVHYRELAEVRFEEA